MQNEADREDEDEKMLMDLNELDDQEKQLLLQYLQDEYEKHPD